MTTKTVLISLFNYDFGLRSISSFLKSKGYPVDVISFGQLKLSYKIFFNNYILAKPIYHRPYSSANIKALLRLLFQLKPDLVGISLSSTTFLTACAITKKIKENFSIPVIWGGIHPTLCPEECIPHTDMVCIGEGEYPMLEVVQKIENKQPLTGIKNLWIKHQDGSIEKNPLRELISDLDSLPYPDFVDYGNKYLIDNGKIITKPVICPAYRKYMYPIMSSRGCIFGCSFCANSVLRKIYKNKGYYHRRRSPENVIEEIMLAISSRTILSVWFWDDIFAYDEDWIARFSELYRKKIAIPFTCNAHPAYTKKQIIMMLKEAGLTYINMGIQSGSEEFCRKVFRRYSLNQNIIEFINFLKDIGIQFCYHFIVDNPAESEEDFNYNVELMLNLPRLYTPYEVALYSLCFMPKVEFTHYLLKNDIIKEDVLETKTYKALYNWYMFLDLTKNKKLLFRGTIMAMIASGFFKKENIIKIKNNLFFKKYPKILVILLRLDLRLRLLFILIKLYFKKITMGLDDRDIFDLKLLQRLDLKILFKFILKYNKLNMDQLGLFMFVNDKLNNYENYIFFKKSNLQENEKIKLFIFSDNIYCESSIRFKLKIVRNDNNKIPLFIELWIRINSDKLYSDIAGLWRTRLEVFFDSIDMDLEINYPRVFLFLHNDTREAELLYNKDDYLVKNKLYMISLGIYDKTQKFIIWKQNRIFKA